jgi:hypothetical protein
LFSTEIIYLYSLTIKINIMKLSDLRMWGVYQTRVPDLSIGKYAPPPSWGRKYQPLSFERKNMKRGECERKRRKVERKREMGSKNLIKCKIGMKRAKRT